MKKLSVILSLLLVVIASGCHKSANTPVDEYIGILDRATEKAEKISSMNDLLNVQEIISPEAALEIVKENSGYQLTDKDKDKLKKSYDKLLRVAYDKTAEYGGLPDEYKEQAKAQVELIIEAANKSIDAASTLGDLNGIN